MTKVLSTSEVIPTSSRGTILESLCAHAPQSRSELARRTGLPLPTVHRLCSQLKDDGLIEDTGETHYGLGRPVQLLRFNPQAHASVAINIRSCHIDGALFGLDGTILHGETIACEEDDDQHAAPQYLQLSIQLIASLIGWADNNGIAHTGIGVALPGIVRPNGNIDAANELGWNKTPLRSILQTQFDDIIIIENNANAFTYGEFISMNNEKKNPVVGFIMRPYGVGAGIVSNGQVLHGFHGSAGELGYMLTSSSSLTRYYPAKGNLEELIYRIGLSGKMTEADDGKVRELLDLVALSIANLCLVTDPEILVVDVKDVIDENVLIEGIRNRLIGRIPNVAEITATQLGQQATLTGIGMLTVQTIRGKVLQ